MLCDTRTYLILAADGRIGPWPDDPSFEPLAARAHARLSFDTLLADAGYDSERAHRFVREALGARSVIPPLRGRPSITGPKAFWRRKMWRRFPRKQYGQRWQVEALFSQDKRRFGSQLSGSTRQGQFGELCIRVLVHNIAIILRRQIRPALKPAI